MHNLVQTDQQEDPSMSQNAAPPRGTATINMSHLTWDPKIMKKQAD